MQRTKQLEIIKQRLEFIDVARSLAILLMLEGHFIILALDPDFRDKSSMIYFGWQSIRSITAPLFFTVSGIIFTYLLLRNRELPLHKNPRILKGIRRGIMLIILGYLLHLDLYYIIKGYFSDYFYSIHVLQCIGFALITIVLLFSLYKLIRVIPLTFLLAGAAFACFIVVPTINNTDLSDLPLWFRNIFSSRAIDSHYASGFPIFPWMGYSLFGGALGSVLFHHPEILDRKRNVLLISGLMAFGIIMVYEILSMFNWVLVPLGMSSIRPTGIQFIKQAEVVFILILIYLFTKNRLAILDFIKTRLTFFTKWYAFIPFGLVGAFLMIFNESLSAGILSDFPVTTTAHILLFVALVFVLIALIPWNYQLFIKVGQHTLLIYVVHTIILYGAFFGYGLNYEIKKELHPWVAIFGAIAFITFFVLLVKYREKIISLFTFRKKNSDPASDL